MYGALSNPLVLPDDFEKAIGEAFKYFQENINNSQKRPTLFDKSIFIEANEIIDDKPQGFWHIISLETKHQFKVLPCVNDCTIDICNQNCINGQRKVKIKHGTEERNICLLRASRLPWVVDIINLANKDNSQIKMWLKENKNYNNQKLYILDSKTDKYINYELDSFVPQSMYIYNNRIILLGSIIEQTYEKSFYWKYYSNNAIKILQINNEDINNISEIRLSEFYSSYISESRLIDKYLYIKLYAFNIYDSNADKINPFTYKDSFKGDEIITLKEENVFFVGEKKASRYNYEVLIGLDISEEKDIDVNAYLGGLGTIYSSKNGIFTSKTYYSINKKTYFYHFIYDEEKIVFDNFTSIDGTNYIYNNFSMDEYNGTFRTVVTSSNANNQRESYVYTFNIKDHKFDFISKIGGIGVNESVYSIRFDKERLYIVTFRTIDPYYVIDVSDPANMKILGELKLPGVSDYLHVITDNLQLGIGRRTKDNGYGGVTSDGYSRRYCFSIF